jgi:N-acetylglucosamine kinase-like BadF-type ATPase
MILIADSGSTKCDWALIDEKGTRLGNFETMGLNPYFHNEEIIANAIKGNAPLALYANKIERIYFYGAGSSTEIMCAIVERGLRSVFPTAEIIVDHDLVGSAYATYDGRPCISCILGTGSNSCFFDGKEISEAVPSLAYILGDEASGSYFGKILLREYFYKKLPADLRTSFEESFNLTKDEFISRIYREPNANVYLASFTRFIGQHAHHPHVMNWVVNGMKEFIDIHVKSFENWENTPVHFVGSISHYFEHCLEIAAKEEGILLGQIIKKPIDGLVNYHVKYVFPFLKQTQNG